MENNNLAQAPPPAYQNSPSKPGQTYYQPPNTPDAGGYAPPPPINQQPPTNMGQRVTQFYAPPQNKKLGTQRRIWSVICCCIIIGLIIGLAVGLTTNSYYGYATTNCNCRVNSDCIAIYGPGTFCYNGCVCAR